MNVLTIDYETTTHESGNFHSNKNKAVCLGVKENNKPTEVIFDLTYPCWLNDYDLVVAFNAKFELGWSRRLGFEMPKQVWCCQLAEYMLDRQKPYPSLEETAKKYGLSSKLDLVKEEFWNRKCSCHVSIVERILYDMQEVYAPNVIAEILSGKIDKNEIKKKENGEKQIQINIKQSTLGKWKNYALILQQRLMKPEQEQSDSTTLPINSMMLSWSKQVVVFAEKQVGCVLTTITQQEQFESDFADLAMLLLDTLKKNHGYLQHSHICKNTPIDTPGIPQTILSDYCIQDVDLTYAIYQFQLSQFQKRPALFKLFKLACQDLLVLAEMEWNGLPFNEQLCKERAAECEKKKQEILAVLSSVYPDVPINFGSTDQLSAFLYGGCVVQTVKQPVGVFKTGERKGQVKFQNVDIEHKLPRLVEPLKNSELKKPGFYATDEGTLKKLKGPFAKKYVSLILRLARLDKLIGTYYEGLPKLNKTMDWDEGMLYPQYNQVVTQTGRLSSSRPNGQNLSNEIADVIESVYD